MNDNQKEVIQAPQGLDTKGVKAPVKDTRHKTEDVMTNGSLAFANKAVYLRTHKKLWKFAKTP